MAILLPSTEKPESSSTLEEKDEIVESEGWDMRRQRVIAVSSGDRASIGCR